MLKEKEFLMKQKGGKSRGGREKGRHSALSPKLWQHTQKKFKNHQHNHNESGIHFHP